MFKFLGHKNQPQRNRIPASAFIEVVLDVLTPVCECIEAQKLLRPLEESFANNSHIAFRSRASRRVQSHSDEFACIDAHEQWTTNNERMTERKAKCKFLHMNGNRRMNRQKKHIRNKSEVHSKKHYNLPMGYYAKNS